jgi:hypothetical protein
MTMIITILLLILLCLIIINLTKMEQFQVKCPPYTVRLAPHNSHNSFSKGWCTNASFEDLESDDYIDTDYNYNTSNRCLSNQTYIDPYNSYDSESKGFCKS